MFKRKKTHLILFAFIILTVMIFPGCMPAGQDYGVSQNEQDMPVWYKQRAPIESGLKLGWICWALSQNWFIGERYGFERVCEENGVEFIAYDSKGDDQLALQAAEALIHQGVQAIIINHSTMTILPQIANMCNEAGIIILSSIEAEDSFGYPIPEEGYEYRENCVELGRELARRAIEKGFYSAGNNVKIIIIKNITDAFWTQRADGQYEGLKEGLGSYFDDKDVIFVEVDKSTFEEAVQKVPTAVTANPDATHWIVTGVNDDCVYAATKVFNEKHFDLSKTLFGGHDGDVPTLEVMKAGGVLAKNWCAIFMDPEECGASQAEKMIEYLKTGSPMDKKLINSAQLVDIDNWLQFYPSQKIPWLHES